MVLVYQSCRICGARTPSGFTNCDYCYRSEYKEEVDNFNRYPSHEDNQKLRRMRASEKILKKNAFKRNYHGNEK